MNHLRNYLNQAASICQSLGIDQVEAIIEELVTIRSGNGRVFFLGIGGSAANCSHAVNDFRKIAGIEAYACTDNASELTARTNDEGWDTIFSSWLRVSRAGKGDAIFIMSVGGGDKQKNVSPNLVMAIDYALQHGVRILGIVGRDGGETQKKGHAVVLVPNPDQELVTPLTESFHSVVWHAIVTHPKIKKAPNKWESLMQN